MAAGRGTSETAASRSVYPRIRTQLRCESVRYVYYTSNKQDFMIDIRMYGYTRRSVIFLFFIEDMHRLQKFASTPSVTANSFGSMYRNEATIS